MTQPPFGSLQSIAEVLRHRAADTPDRLAYLWLTSDGDEGPRLTYAALDQQASRIASALRQIAAPSDRALLLFAPGLEFIPAFFGCLYAGLIAVPAYPPRPDRPWISHAALSKLVEDCRPRVVLTGGEAAATIEASCRGLEGLATTIWINTSDVPDNTDRRWSREAESSQAISHLQYTSGTTDTPKGVMISHGNLMHNEHLIALCSGHYDTAAAGICGVGWLPFQHDLGLVAGMLQALYVGGPLVLMSPLTMLQRPYVWLEAVSRYRGHTSGGPNFAWDLCVRRLNSEQVRSLDLGSWTVAGIGAEPIRAASMDRFAEHFAAAGFCREAFYPSYGLAEATLFVAGGKRTAPPVTLSVAASSADRGEVATVTAGADVGATRTLVGCGNAWLDQELAIVDPEAGVALPDGHVGEIWVSGPSIAQGYWNRRDESATVFRAELGGSPGRTFLRTGDLGFVRDEKLFVTGRIKDLLIIRGQNHYPQDLEETVQSVDPAFRVDGGAAFQVEHDAGARLVVIQEIDRRRATLDPVALARRVRSVIAERHGIEIDEIVFVRNGTLSKTTSGKVQRYACKAAYEAGRLAHWRSDDTPRHGMPRR